MWYIWDTYVIYNVLLVLASLFAFAALSTEQRALEAEDCKG